MDQNEVPLLDALADYHRVERYGFTPPGHRQGRGADERTRGVLGELETVLLPRDAFFGPKEAVPVECAAGRIVAEQVTPYPPGIPVLVPGERINTAVIDYLRSGISAGMVLPDPADRTFETVL